MDRSCLSLFLIVLGTAGYVRLFSELLVAGDESPAYRFLIAVDATLAFGMMAAGAGLRNERPWAPKLSLALAGPLLLTSIAMGLVLLPRILQPGAAAPADARAVLLPRLLYYVANIGFWPYVVRRMLRDAPADVRRILWTTFGFSLALGAGVTAGLLVGFHLR